MKRLLIISVVMSGLHFIEDLILFLIGRFTQIHFSVVILSVIILGVSTALLSTHPKIRKFLH